MSISFSFIYNSSSLRFGLRPWQFQNKIFKPMKVIKGYLSWMVMRYCGLLGGFRLFGDSLDGVIRCEQEVCEALQRKVLLKELCHVPDWLDKQKGR